MQSKSGNGNAKEGRRGGGERANITRKGKSKLYIANITRKGNHGRTFLAYVNEPASLCWLL